MFRHRKFKSHYVSGAPVHELHVNHEDLMKDGTLHRRVYLDNVDMSDTENFKDMMDYEDAKLQNLLDAGVVLKKVDTKILNPESLGFYERVSVELAEVVQQDLQKHVESQNNE